MFWGILSNAHVFGQISWSTGVDWARGGGAPDLGFRPSADGREGEGDPRPGSREAEPRAPPHFRIFHCFSFPMSIYIYPTINHIFYDIYHMNTSVSGAKGPSKGVQNTCFATQGMARDVVSLCHMIVAILSCCVLEYCCLHIFQRALLPKSYIHTKPFVTNPMKMGIS